MNEKTFNEMYLQKLNKTPIHSTKKERQIENKVNKMQEKYLDKKLLNQLNKSLDKSKKEEQETRMEKLQKRKMRQEFLANLKSEVKENKNSDNNFAGIDLINKQKLDKEEIKAAMLGTLESDPKNKDRINRENVLLQIMLEVTAEFDHVEVLGASARLMGAICSYFDSHGFVCSVSDGVQGKERVWDVKFEIEEVTNS